MVLPVAPEIVRYLLSTCIIRFSIAELAYTGAKFVRGLKAD